MDTRDGSGRLAEELPDGIQIGLSWEGVEDLPMLLVNQVLGQVGQQGEVILTFGQVAPPILMGDLDQQRERAQGIPFVPIKPVARLALTRAGLDDMIHILNQTRDNYDRALEMPPSPGEEGD
jgi:hypothetical protein